MKHFTSFTVHSFTTWNLLVFTGLKNVYNIQTKLQIKRREWKSTEHANRSVFAWDIKTGDNVEQPSSSCSYRTSGWAVNLGPSLFKCTLMIYSMFSIPCSKRRTFVSLDILLNLLWYSEKLIYPTSDTLNKHGLDVNFECFYSRCSLYYFIFLGGASAPSESMEPKREFRRNTNVDHQWRQRASCLGVELQADTEEDGGRLGGASAPCRICPNSGGEHLFFIHQTWVRSLNYKMFSRTFLLFLLYTIIVCTVCVYERGYTHTPPADTHLLTSSIGELWPQSSNHSGQHFSYNFI